MFRIPERMIPWYRRHVEFFIDDHPSMQLKEHSVVSIEAWLGSLGRNSQVNEWVFRQKVDALTLIFYHYLKVAWAKQIEWNHWLSGTKALGRDHPKVLRSHEMIEKTTKEASHRLGKKYP